MWHSYDVRAPELGASTAEGHGRTRRLVSANLEHYLAPRERVRLERIACHRLTPAALRQFTVASVSETLLVVEDAKLGGEGGYPQGPIQR